MLKTIVLSAVLAAAIAAGSGYGGYYVGRHNAVLVLMPVPVPADEGRSASNTGPSEFQPPVA